MLASFKYSLIQIARMPEVLVWAFVFPIILGSLFSIMFSGLDEADGTSTIRVVQVKSADDGVGDVGDAYGGDSAVGLNGATKATSAPSVSAIAFDGFVESLASGDDALFEVTEAPTVQEAELLLRESLGTDGEYAGYVYFDKDADKPKAVFAKTASASDNFEIGPSVLMMVMDRYAANEALVKGMMEENPQVFADMAFVNSLTDPIMATVQIAVTENQPKESLRYFFALFGMAAFFGATIGLMGFQRIRPNASPVAARRSLGTLSHMKTVLITLLVCWLLSFASLMVLYAFMSAIGRLDFAGRDGMCVLICLVASLCSTAAGAAIAGIPCIPDQVKSGILSGLVCISSLFAGLYGEPAMAFADMVSENLPVIDYLNPCVQVCQAFYGTMYYDTYENAFMHLGVLLIMAAIFFALSARSLKRTRYAIL